MASPGNANGAADQGTALLQAGRLHEAEQHFRAILQRTPRDAQALHGLGLVACRAGHYADALGLFDRAIASSPSFAGAWVNRGLALAGQGRHEDAIASFRRGLEISPGMASALVNMATALHALGRLDDAVAALEQAGAAQPGSPDIPNNLGNLYKDQGRLAEAIACYQRALALNPMLQQAFSNFLAACKLDPGLSPAAILDKHREWSCWFEAVSGSAPVLANAPDRERSLRIGYVSPDCHTAIPAFIDPVIAAHDRRRFEVYCYFNNPQPPARLRELGVQGSSRVLHGLDDQQVANAIHADRIDVLVDIAGHTGHNRLGVFARRPAPVQVTWLDYLCTTGLEAIAYRITDALADPAGSEAFHSEALLRMPCTQWCWRPDPASPPVSPAPLQHRGTVTFGSFNHAQKLTDATLELWRALLAALPQSRLRLAGVPEGRARSRVLAGLACDASRVDFQPRVDIGRYRESFAEVDIALDPHPFSGATTTLDALWQGVPVLTLPGASSCSRSSASLLAAIGMQDWIATDADDFVARAKRLCADAPALVALRARLRERLAASPILDAAGFTRDLETLYRGAWRHWCETRVAADADPRQVAGTDAALRVAVERLEAGQTDPAIEALRQVLAVRPHWAAAQREFARAALAWARAHPEARPAWEAPVAPVRAPQSVSAVICSIRPDYFARLERSLAAQFAGHDFEVIGIHDAASLCEGYNRGAAKAKGDVLLFCHDDIEPVHADFGHRVLHHLASNDIVGLVGTSRLVDGDWGHGGMPHVHGQIVHRPPGESGYIYLGVGLQAPVARDIQAMDGVFLATHRRVWESVGFDASTFDGFHLYDIDFTYRAHLAGLRLAVPMDLLLIHFSTGRYDLAWQAFNRRFLAKFPQLSNRPAMRRHASLHVKLQSLEQVERLHAALYNLRFGAGPDGGNPSSP